MADHMETSTRSEPKLSKKRKLGKNKKKSWRAIDISKTEEFLEDERFQLRTTGLLSEKIDAELFMVDKTKAKVFETGRVNKRTPKPLHCFAILNNTSRIECPRIDDWSAVQRKEKVKGSKDKRKPRVKTQANHHPKNQGKDLPNLDHDLWSDEKEKVEEDEFYMQFTKKRRVKPPVKPAQHVTQAVEPPHPGASYNPSYEDHQDLLLKAVLVEKQKEKEEQKVFRALDAYFPAEAPGETAWVKEMSAGLFVETDPVADSVTEKEEAIVKALPGAKTKKQKRKAREQKEMKQRLLQEKAAKIRENMVYRINTLRSELHREAKTHSERAAVRANKREVKRTATKKLGKLKYSAPDLEVKLSHELVGSLRQLKPEGHLLEDRYKSLQKRNIIETRMPAKKIKTKKKAFWKKNHRITG